MYICQILPKVLSLTLIDESELNGFCCSNALPLLIKLEN